MKPDQKLETSDTTFDMLELKDCPIAPIEETSIAAQEEISGEESIRLGIGISGDTV